MSIVNVLLDLLQVRYVIALVLLAVIAYVYFNGGPSNKKKDKLPPGPRGWPIVGYWPHLGSYPHMVFDELGKIYGNIFKMNVGNQTVIVLNDFQAIKEAFVKQADTFADRPDVFYLPNYVFDSYGVFIQSGAPYREQRRFMMNTLKEFGVGKASIENLVHSECQVAVNRVKTLDGTPFDPMPLFGCISANVMAQFLIDHHFDYDDAIFHRLMKLSQILDVVIGSMCAVDFLPWIKYLPERINGLGYIRETKEEIQAFFLQRIEEHVKQFDESRIRDYIDVHIEKMNARKKQGTFNATEDSFDLQHLCSNVMQMFIGGFGATSTILSLLMKVFTVHPEIQDKVREEVDRVIGQERTPQYSDRLNMPYTEATVFEALRYGDIAPLGNYRCNSERTQIFGYDIPKKSIVFAHFGHLHKDPTYWKNPDKFDPTHFLNENGKSFRPDYLMPFGTGKRLCPAQSYSEMQIFLVLTSMIQQFTIHSPVGAKAEIEPITGTVRYLKPFKVCAKVRT